MASSELLVRSRPLSRSNGPLTPIGPSGTSGGQGLARTRRWSTPHASTYGAGRRRVSRSDASGATADLEAATDVVAVDGGPGPTSSVPLAQPAIATTAHSRAVGHRLRGMAPSVSGRRPARDRDRPALDDARLHGEVATVRTGFWWLPPKKCLTVVASCAILPNMSLRDDGPNERSRRA